MKKLSDVTGSGSHSSVNYGYFYFLQFNLIEGHRGQIGLIQLLRCFAFYQILTGTNNVV